MNSLDEYVGLRDFTRLSLLMTGLDEHSRDPVLFVSLSGTSHNLIILTHLQCGIPTGTTFSRKEAGYWLDNLQASQGTPGCCWASERKQVTPPLQRYLCKPKRRGFSSSHLYEKNIDHGGEELYLCREREKERERLCFEVLEALSIQAFWH